MNPTRNEIIEAQLKIEILVPAIVAVGEVAERLNLDETDIEKINNFSLWLDSLIENAHTIINAAPSVMGERFPDINSAVTARIEQIENEIALEQAAIESLSCLNRIRQEQLMNKGFSSPEIAAIIPSFETDLDRYSSTINLLRSERDRLEQFIESQDESDLECTGLKHLLNAQ